VGPTKLAKYWPPSVVEWSTKGVRDAFYSSPQLPRLLNPTTIRRAIADGVTQGLLGYASKDAAGRFNLVKFQESLSESEVEIADDVFILKAADAVKLKEPPRLACLVVRPEHPLVKPHEQVAFTCTAQDQYGQPHPLATVTWSATGGVITTQGIYTAGAIGGLHTVTATAGRHECLAEVRVRTEEPQPDPVVVEEKPGKRTIRWRGSIPTQKWMNFYTKVLSRFAASTELKVEVSFEVTVDREQAQSKADETRSGLKELGLDDNVSQNG